MAAKRAPATAKSKRVFGQRRDPAKMFRVGLYARVSERNELENRLWGNLEPMGLRSLIQRISNLASGMLNDFLWKHLRPTTVSPSGLPITLSSLSDWDIFSEIWVSGEYDEPILRVLN